MTDPISHNEHLPYPEDIVLNFDYSHNKDNLNGNREKYSVNIHILLTYLRICQVLTAVSNQNSSRVTVE